MPANRARPDQRQDNRRTRKLAVVTPVETADLGPRQPRTGWRKATKVAWAQFWSSAVAGAVESQDEHAAYRLFDMRDRQQRAWERYDKQPYVDGSMGQPVANPAMSDALSLEKAIIALEDRMALSPKARAALGLAFGQAALTAADLNAMANGEPDARTDDILEVEGWEEVN